jgi:hypothetical protein
MCHLTSVGTALTKGDLTNLEPDVVNTNSFRWLRDPDGVHAGWFGLALTARDMITRPSCPDCPDLGRDGVVRPIGQRQFAVQRVLAPPYPQDGPYLVMLVGNNAQISRRGRP